MQLEFTTLEIVLGLLLVITLIVILGLLVVPAGLRRLATGNQARRRTLIKGIQTLDQQIIEAERRTVPFRALQSPLYHQRVAAVDNQLTLLREQYQTLLGINGLSFPKVPARGLPLAYFLSHPGDAGGVLITRQRLRQLEGQLDEADGMRRALEVEQKTLASATEHLQESVQQLANHRLPALASSLDGERRQGLLAMEELQSSVASLQARSIDIVGRMQVHDTQDLTGNDAFARELDELVAECQEMESQVARISQARTELDDRYAGALKALSGCQSRLQPEQQERFRGLLAHGRSQLEEAHALRCSRAFVAAQKPLTKCEQLTGLASELIVLEKAVGQLVERESDALNDQAIANLSLDLTALWAEIVLVVGRPSDDGQWPSLPLQAMEKVAAITARSGRMQELATEIQSAFDADARHWDKQAQRRHQGLSKAWASLEKVIALSNADPLAARYHTALRAIEAAQTRPSQLQAFCRSAQDMTDDIREAEHYLRKRLPKTRNLIREQAGMVARVEQEAGGWACLDPYVEKIRHNSRQIEEVGEQLTADGLLGETHDRFDRIKWLDLQNKSSLESLVLERGRLRRLEDSIGRARTAIDNSGDDLDPTRVERILELVDYHQQQAHDSVRFDGALASLRTAETFINQLAAA